MGEISTSELSPLCYVLMPFGLRFAPRGGPDINFNRIYSLAVKPGIEDAGMFPFRADEKKFGGILHKALFERLLVCDFAVADLTTSNPNILYELGIRHAARPRSIIYAASTPLPFDANLLHAQPYHLDANNELSASRAAELRKALAENLRNRRERTAQDAFVDSPLFQQISQWKPEPLVAEAAEFLDEKVKENEKLKKQLRPIQRASMDVGQRSSLLKQLAQIRSAALANKNVDVGVLTEIMLTYRALESWSDMIDIQEEMPDLVKQQGAIRKQLAFALNRRAEATNQPDDRVKALNILERLQEEEGHDAATSGLIGRIYKSQWREAEMAHDPAARRFLLKAIEAYIHGFEADVREVYPGINAITLFEMQGGRDALARKEKLLQGVRFAADQKVRDPNATYWDHATLLEVAVLAGDVDGASEALDRVLRAYTETWQPKSTAGNLRLIQERRRQRGDDVAWMTGLTNCATSSGGRGVGYFCCGARRRG